VELSIVDGPRPGDATIEGSGFRLHVDPSLSGTLDVAEPHETFVLSPDA
jgi:hypothetical protein